MTASREPHQQRLLLEHSETVGTDGIDAGSAGSAIKCPRPCRVWNLDWYPAPPSSSPAGPDYLAVALESKNIMIYRVAASAAIGSPICQAKYDLRGAHTRTIRWVDYSRSGRRLAAASFDGTVSIWSQMATGEWQCIANLEGHENEVKSVAWSPNDKYLATCGRDRTVWIWAVEEADDDPDPSMMVRQAGDELGFECVAVLQEHAQDVKCVKWNPRLPLLASASYDNTIKLWSNVTQAGRPGRFLVGDEDDDDVDAEWLCIATLVRHETTVWAVDFDPTGDYLVSVGDDGSVIVWRRWIEDERSRDDLRSWHVHQQLNQIHQRAIYSVSWINVPVMGSRASGGGDAVASSTMAYLATGSRDRSICVLTAAATTKDVIADNGDGADSDDAAAAIDYGEFALVCRTDMAHQDEINSVQWHPTAAVPRLASSSDDGTLRLWRLQQQQV